MVIVAAIGSTGETSHSATPSNTTPKSDFTFSIQRPARGSSVPADNPSSSSGTLMPAARANRAVPPSTTSRVWLM